MWPITDRFAAAIRHSHEVVQRAEILQDDQVIFDLTAAGVLVDGAVTAQRAEVQRTASNVVLIDRDGTLTPDTVDDLLVPTGRQLRLWRGLVYPDATEDERLAGTDRELVPLGTFRFTTTETESGQITLTNVYDRAWIVQGALLENVVTIPAGTLVTDAIASLLTTAYPDVPLDLSTTDEVTPLMVFDGDADPWAAAQELAANVGQRLFFNPLGVATMRPEPDPTADPVVWTFDDADAASMLLPGLRQTWTGTSYNSVTVSGESTSLTVPVRATVRDLEPTSPTRYGGPYGKRPMPLITDTKIATAAQCEARALKELQSQLGIAQQVNFSTWGHPALDVADLVYVASTSRGVAQYFILDSVGIPLRGAGTMDVTTRARLLVTLV